MTHRIKQLITKLSLIVVVSVTGATSLPLVRPTQPAPVQAKAKPFKLKKAKAAVALDAETGKVVWSKQANTARPVASIAKLMTLYLAAKKATDQQAWSHKVTIKSNGLVRMSHDGACGGFHFKRGQKFTVKQLYEATMIHSSNNAAIQLGIYVAGSNKAFIKKMNQQAHQWHLGHAKFVSASGLETSDLRRFGYAYSSASANKISAKDMALIAKHLITDYTDTVKIAQVKSKKVAGQTVYNYNNLLKGRKYYQKSLHVDGLKTGYTPLAGYCFVGTAHVPGKHRLITVVLHDEDEFTETRALMKHVNASGQIDA